MFSLLLGQPSTILQTSSIPLTSGRLLPFSFSSFYLQPIYQSFLFCCLLPNHVSISSQGQTIKYFLKQKPPEKNYATSLGAKAALLFVVLTSIFLPPCYFVLSKTANVALYVRVIITKDSPCIPWSFRSAIAREKIVTT